MPMALSVCQSVCRYVCLSVCLSHTYVHALSLSRSLSLSLSLAGFSGHCPCCTRTKDICVAILDRVLVAASLHLPACDLCHCVCVCVCSFAAQSASDTVCLTLACLLVAVCRHANDDTHLQTQQWCMTPEGLISFLWSLIAQAYTH